MDGIIRPYRTSGFLVEGRRRRAIYGDGRYLDDLMMMALVLLE